GWIVADAIVHSPCGCTSCGRNSVEGLQEEFHSQVRLSCSVCKVESECGTGITSYSWCSSLPHTQCTICCSILIACTRIHIQPSGGCIVLKAKVELIPCCLCCKTS